MSTPSLVEKGTYQRYIQSAVFGVIVSPKAGIACDRSGELGFAAAAALEDINIWDLQKGVIAKRLHAEVSADQQLGEVTALDACTGDDGTRMVAAGTTTGAVRLFRIDTGENTTTFSGHRSGVNVVRYARGGSLLASGGQNGDVVVWDVVAERGLYRLRGHRDAATDLAFVYSDMDVGISETPRVLLSSSKDSTIKAWDLETQHCVQTLMGHRSEVPRRRLKYKSPGARWLTPPPPARARAARARTACASSRCGRSISTTDAGAWSRVLLTGKSVCGPSTWSDSRMPFLLKMASREASKSPLRWVRSRGRATTVASQFALCAFHPLAVKVWSCSAASLQVRCWRCFACGQRLKLASA